MNYQVVRYGLALVVGIATARLQGFTGAEGIGASCSGLLFGSLLGFIYSFFRTTDISKWALGFSIIGLLAALAR